MPPPAGKQHLVGGTRGAIVSSRLSGEFGRRQTVFLGRNRLPRLRSASYVGLEGRKHTGIEGVPPSAHRWRLWRDALSLQRRRDGSLFWNSSALRTFQNIPQNGIETLCGRWIGSTCWFHLGLWQRREARSLSRIHPVFAGRANEEVVGLSKITVTQRTKRYWLDR